MGRKRTKKNIVYPCSICGRNCGDGSVFYEVEIEKSKWEEEEGWHVLRTLKRKAFIVCKDCAQMLKISSLLELTNKAQD